MRQTGRKCSHHVLVTSDWRGANSAKESSANLAPRQHWWEVLQTYGGSLKGRRCQNIRLSLRTAVDMNIRFGFERVPGFWCEWYCDGVGFVDTQGCMDAERFNWGWYVEVEWKVLGEGGARLQGVPREDSTSLSIVYYQLHFMKFVNVFSYVHYKF